MKIPSTPEMANVVSALSRELEAEGERIESDKVKIRAALLELELSLDRERELKTLYSEDLGNRNEVSSNLLMMLRLGLKMAIDDVLRLVLIGK